MANKTIYVSPGETVEIRVCGEGYEKNAREWSRQNGGRPRNLLLRVHDERRISFVQSTGFGRVVDWATGEDI